MMGRKFHTNRFPAFGGAVNRNAGELIWLQSPPFWITKDFRQLPTFKSPYHPFIRPFRNFLLKGDPNTGKIWFISIKSKDDPIFRALGSIVLTSGLKNLPNGTIGLSPNRLLFFPALGPGILRYVSQNGKEIEVSGVRIDHYTIEEAVGGKIRIHITILDEAIHNKKQRLFQSSPALIKDEKAHHIAALCLRNIRSLDPAGNPFSFFVPPNMSKKSEDIINASLALEHPLLEIPDFGFIPTKHFLRIDFLFTKFTVEDRDYPKAIIGRKQFKDGARAIPGSIERIIPLPIKENLTLLIILRIAEGEPLNDLIWHVGKRIGDK